jgi:hypothetical protein
MINSKPFLLETAQTAAFAFREYFRPLVAVTRFLKSNLASSKIAEAPPETKATPENGQATLGEVQALPREQLRSRQDKNPL